MTWRLICKHADVLASAAPAAAAGPANISVEVPCEFAGAEGPTRELDILYMHGTEDALVNFPNALAQRDAVVRRFGLGSAQPVSSSAAHTWTRHENASGTRFEFIQHGYTTDAAVGAPPLGVALRGHCYPGSRDLVASVPGQLMAFGCKTPAPSAFTWGRAAMQFFLEHPKR